MKLAPIRMPSSRCDRVVSEEARAAISQRMFTQLREPSFRKKCGFLQESDYAQIKELIRRNILYRVIAKRFDVSTPYIAELAMRFGMARGRSANNWKRIAMTVGVADIGQGYKP